MAYKYREEIVGKRFLSVSGFTKLKLGRCSEWGWRSGVVRAATHKDNTNKELQVLVEYDDVEWHRREWISIYKDSLFRLFMVEQGLCWAERRDPYANSHGKVIWPALTFLSLVSTVEIPQHTQPVEFLLDHELAFTDYKQLKPFQEWDSSLSGVREYPELKASVKRWAEQQDGQRILLATPSVLVGYRVEVYRAEGTTQWYTAVIVGYNEATRDLTVTDDTVLEEHNEDPALVQMRLIGDGVVESIMRGENVGITPRRSRSTVLQAQYYHQQQTGRVIRGISLATPTNTASTTVTTRKPKSSPSEDKGSSSAKAGRKRKSSENESTSKQRHAGYLNVKEDLENKQGRKRNVVNHRGNAKKKVLEEATNSKLRVVQVRVEDCLQNAALNDGALSAVCRRSLEEEESAGEQQAEEEEEDDDEEEPTVEEEDVSSGVGELVVVNEAKKPTPKGEYYDADDDDDGDVRKVVVVVSGTCNVEGGNGVEEQRVSARGGGGERPPSETVVAEVVSEEDDCVIVTATPKIIDECPLRGDDEGPLSSSSPFNTSRMELADSAHGQLLRFPDDRSDSGVSSLRSGSGDERSGSRSSALSSSDEPPPPPSHQQQQLVAGPQSASVATLGVRPLQTRSPLFVPSSTNTPPAPYSVVVGGGSGSVTASTPGPGPGPGAAAPQSAAAIDAAVRVWRDPNLLLESEPHVRHIHSVQHHTLLMSHPSQQQPPGQQAQPAAHPTLYPPVPPPPPSALMSPHLSHHPHLPPPALYTLRPEMVPALWGKQYIPGHLPLPQVPPQTSSAAEELLERDRVLAQDRDRQERQERQRQSQEIEKQKEKEREQRERERQERERMEKMEREKQEKEQQQAQAAVQKHFEESLRRMQKQPHAANAWTGFSLPPPRGTSADEERKRAEQEHHQREQQRRAMAASRPDSRDKTTYYTNTVQRPSSVPSKTDYPPPAHSRERLGSGSKSNEKLMHNLNPEVNAFGYPAYQPPFFPQDPSKLKDHHKGGQPGGQVMIKSMERERELLQNPSIHIEAKNSVIVKHEKNPHHLDVTSRMSQAHSKSPQLRTDLMSHYMSSSQHKPSMYTLQDYRSPTQSPHHVQHPHAPSPHHHEAQNLGKTHHSRTSSQQPSPHHPHSQQHPSPELRYRNDNHISSLYNSKSITKGTLNSVSYTYVPPATTISHYTIAAGTSLTNMKPKVSSPAPHHIYGKPSAGIETSMPVSRPNSEPMVGVVNPLPLTSKPLSSSVSSPYQQVSQYHPPIPQNTPPTNVLPPPAHSSRLPTTYDRMYPGGIVPGGLAVKPSIQHGTSPPTAASAPSPIARSHQQYSMPGVTYPSQNIPSIPSVQTQPLDFCVTPKYDSATSPKRKATPVSSASAPMCLEKKRRVETPPHPYANQSTQQPQLARVSEPSSLIANAATTITTVVNAAALRTTPTSMMQGQPVPMESLPSDVSVISIVSEKSPGARDACEVVVSPTVVQNITPPPSTTPVDVALNSCATPIKVVEIVNPDSEKSNSPGPNKAVSSTGSTTTSTVTTTTSLSTSTSSHPIRHLKKAWLQRHTGEDVVDRTGITGTGSCVTLPINITNNVPKEPTTVTSLHSIGSMAVNSINKTKHFGAKTNNRKSHKDNSLNGDAAKADDSSSSDQERNRKDPPKRKPPKVKRKKGGTAAKKVEEHKKRKVTTSTSNPPIQSESGSDSEKESGSEKDSDSGASTTVAPVAKKTPGPAVKDKEPRKRGRRPKTSKNDKSEEPRTKKSKEEALPQRDPFRKPPVGQLKKTGESFLQDGPCFEVAPKLAKCRECRWTPNQRSKNMPNIFCRFYAFRRLRYTKNGQLAIAGFSDPHKDASEDDLKLWLPSADKPPTDLDLETSRFILKQVGDHFCNLLTQEKDAHGEHMSEEKTIAWKRVVQGVREMCDVCETTLFNIHWTCGKCGFVVCLDCYKGRKNKTIKIWGEPGKDRDDYSWLLCTNRQPHEQEKLMLTQIIAGDSLTKLGRLVHEMRELWNVEQHCECPLSKEINPKTNGTRKELIKCILSGENGIKKEIKEESDVKPLANGANTTSVKDEKNSLSWLADVALSNEDKKNEDTSDSEDGSFSTLRELLIRPSHKHNGSRAGSPVSAAKTLKKTGRFDATLEEIISTVVEDGVPKLKEETISPETKIELKHFVRKDNYLARIRGMLPIRIMTLTESKLLYPDIPHSWLCDGKLLRLNDTTHQGNTKIFQDQWKRGQPVLVSDVTKHLSKDLWTPEAFIRDFGEDKNDLINCLTGNLVLNQPMRKFWEGFEHLTRRLKDDKGNPMLLKLKDWPPGEDFSDMLPSRFTDLMKVLPLSEYTHRNGRLNLAGRLPECFVRPDLGPKMYNAYGSALHPSKGTTNLHLDISDAVNVMVYVGIPKDGDCDEHIKEAFRAIDEAGCDILTRRRVRDKGELPGALWHIYNARDADKIRDLLNKVVVEKGGCLEPNHDPIHDQSCYLDGPLRERLYKEYGVEGYAIVQCLGDAVFIPAGAPHQVRNLHNCIKVAEDFVSPENVSQCFHLTQEFRDLSDTHTNHEDKLQIKNIIYHAVKDALSVLTSVLNDHANTVKTEKETERSNGSGGNSVCADEHSGKSTDSHGEQV
ncbi:probable JmjC domain-containing histone demethylation protein 2C isoform X1 [Onthophagus taurus]|uniref:probable JmjC domain-containing histone demethylation protein 2C isoform X1 n=1 Tax=Onthophagus taurus TaxID=166361 RepID=UPI0039BE1F8F